MCEDLLDWVIATFLVVLALVTVVLLVWGTFCLVTNNGALDDPPTKVTVVECPS